MTSKPKSKTAGQKVGGVTGGTVATGVPVPSDLTTSGSGEKTEYKELRELEKKINYELEVYRHLKYKVFDSDCVYWELIQKALAQADRRGFERGKAEGIKQEKERCDYLRCDALEEMREETKLSERERCVKQPFLKETLAKEQILGRSEVIDWVKTRLLNQFKEFEQQYREKHTKNKTEAQLKESGWILSRGQWYCVKMKEARARHFKREIAQIWQMLYEFSEDSPKLTKGGVHQDRRGLGIDVIKGLK